MATVPHPAVDQPVDPGEESLLILQSLLCLMREKNLLNRADIEELCAKVERRATGQVSGPLTCNAEAASAAMADMQRMNSYLGQRYGGKHARLRPR
ncbi:hypothetical protein SAMN05192583_2035 [Sphingomonas gellani]|uniref:Uncharacterized protein n=1 Tax=Sphingomonas gellani TaxID=1166340 RepID=A0A1H8DS27_9SPHN|nr:hypothetical protein [Sphingomonas gellani]SEN10040.1 hypothetical protein SAMN05192583_2035 [Sphingomonas gellani]